LITGFIFQILESMNFIEENKNKVEVDKNFSILRDLIYLI
jgi:hypothetical protein